MFMLNSVSVNIFEYRVVDLLKNCSRYQIYQITFLLCLPFFSNLFSCQMFLLLAWYWIEDYKLSNIKPSYFFLVDSFLNPSPTSAIFFQCPMSMSDIGEKHHSSEIKNRTEWNSFPILWYYIAILWKNISHP